MSPQTVPRLCQPWIPQARLTQPWHELISAGCKRLNRYVYSFAVSIFDNVTPPRPPTVGTKNVWLSARSR